MQEALYGVHETIGYLTKVHDGTLLWLNVTLLEKEAFLSSPSLKKRLHQWFVLGLSLAPLLRHTENSFLASLAQVMEEYDHWVENSNSGIKVIQAHTTSMRSSADDSGVIKPKINVYGNRVVYDYLRIYMPIANDLDYFQVVSSLCSVLKQVYLKLASSGFSSQPQYAPIVQKVDGRIKHHFFSFIHKEVNKLSQDTIKEQLSAFLRM
ncbi:hypothetical protein Pelo_13839 [Pelomyxa schiedti]|nr:hypothetical protein Pelo_13839 [Pelomyxa schiedti]